MADSWVGCNLCVQEKGQLLENVFADPKGFGIAPDGRYRYELPGFSAGTAAVS
jgi:pyruvate dehydrogenase E1 component alpha subunit